MSRFTDRIALHLDGLEHVSPGVSEHCPQCPDLDDWDGDTERYHDEAREASFSWTSCDSCGSHLGGDRHPAHAFDTQSGDLYHLRICTDCLFFHANGDEPEEDR